MMMAMTNRSALPLWLSIAICSTSEALNLTPPLVVVGPSNRVLAAVDHSTAASHTPISSIPAESVSYLLPTLPPSSPSRGPANKFSAAAPQCWIATAMLAAALSTAVLPVHADEYGQEVEAPTLFTGENILICKKRGLLGACLETTQRTDENDNDKSKKYFKVATSPSRMVDPFVASTGEGSALIERLKQQSIDNKEKNDLYVQRKSFENSQSGTFGPFDRQVLIMNTDGKTFTLLENPQAMRLKKAGFIESRQFVKQPTQEDLERALSPVADEGDLLGSIGNMIRSTF